MSKRIDGEAATCAGCGQPLGEGEGEPWPKADLAGDGDPSEYLCEACNAARWATVEPQWREVRHA